MIWKHTHTILCLGAHSCRFDSDENTYTVGVGSTPELAMEKAKAAIKEDDPDAVFV